MPKPYDTAENHTAYKGKKVAARKALEWANLNNNTEDVVIALGVPFLSTVWNGSEHLAVWLAYDISATDEGWMITSYRWYSNPNMPAHNAAKSTKRRAECSCGAYWDSRTGEAADYLASHIEHFKNQEA